MVNFNQNQHLMRKSFSWLCPVTRLHHLNNVGFFSQIYKSAIILETFRYLSYFICCLYQRKVKGIKYTHLSLMKQSRTGLWDNWRILFLFVQIWTIPPLNPLKASGMPRAPLRIQPWCIVSVVGALETLCHCLVAYFSYYFIRCKHRDG